MHDELKYKHHQCHHGYHFLQWGMWIFIAGIILGFGVLIHYLVGSTYNNTGDFLSNITLWFGSPLSLSVAYLQLGGLAMAVVGAVACCLSKHSTLTATGAVCSTKDEACHSHGGKNGALILCIIGLIALFITGYIGYFIIDKTWPGFYYTPIAAGKNLWLILQGLSILCFLVGIIMAVCCLCCCKKGSMAVNSNGSCCK